MHFRSHLELQGTHAPFSASQPAWLRYDDSKVVERCTNIKADLLGTELHEWAAQTIRLGIPQKNSKKTLCNYVNDAIGFGMIPEQILYYSDNFYGTADTISFEKNVLRISDLKTGRGPVHREQLEIYAALFCLEYKHDPKDIRIILTIYQHDDKDCWEPEASTIQHIMNDIIHKDNIATACREDN